MADYCTTSQVKAAGRLDISGTSYDTQLAEMVTAASRWIDRYCTDGIDNAFAQGTDATRYYDHRAVQGEALHLDAPLLTVTTLTNGDGAVISSTYYRLWPRNTGHHLQVRLLSAAAWAFAADGEISVAGKWGLALSGATPQPVSEACAMLSAWMFKRYQAALADATANLDIGQLIYGEAMPKQVVALLTPYRAVRMY